MSAIPKEISWDVQGESIAASEALKGRTASLVKDIETNHMRQVARQSLASMVDCYDKAGNSQALEDLSKGVAKCRDANKKASSYFRDVRTWSTTVLAESACMQRYSIPKQPSIVTMFFRCLGADKISCTAGAENWRVQI
jgi:hypothetical protein